MHSAWSDIRISERELARTNAVGAMARADEPSGDARVSLTAVNEAVAEVMRGDNSERIVDQALAATIGGAIRPSVEKMISSKVGSGSELLGLSAFRTVVSQYLQSPAGMQIDAETRRVMLHKLETANRTSAEFSNLVGQTARFAGLGGLSSETAREAARSEGRRSSAEFSHAFNGGPYAAGTLSGEMRGYVDTVHGITAAHVAGVGNYLHGLGVNPQQYAGYFVGSSETIRTAIQDQVKDGKKITDEQIKNPNDVKAIIGAIKAGKIKKEDAPPSVQKIMEDMEKKGVDPAKTDVKDINKYFEQNPKALEGAKKANDKDVAAQAALTDQDKTKQMKTAATPTSVATPSSHVGTEKPKGANQQAVAATPANPAKKERSLGLL